MLGKTKYVAYNATVFFYGQWKKDKLERAFRLSHFSWPIDSSLLKSLLFH